MTAVEITLVLTPLIIALTPFAAPLTELLKSLPKQKESRPPRPIFIGCIFADPEAIRQVLKLDSPPDDLGGD
jgi:hypothetical protein